ncbi:DUF2779 domain-containing protein [Salinibacter altiplanensis]|uniref:DUF2779 domain-containing protein n=1 Tax=Salinibacter altiplanensis TaxID=1803181 RepID=UPI001319D89D|nr:DUF2779 domain-containing protein [Salinibacter altiplanensis]
MDTSLELKSVGPDGYRVHFGGSGSPGEEGRSASLGRLGRDRLEPDQLTKSRYMTGTAENERVMWFDSRGRLSPNIGERWRMEQGNLVAELAREEFPDGEFVGGPPSGSQLQPTRPLFEVRFSVGDMAVRVDMLRPGPSGEWVLTEVKSSTMTSRSSQKKARQDVAFQVHVLNEAGVPLSRAEVMHLNPEYVHPGSGHSASEHSASKPSSNGSPGDESSSNAHSSNAHSSNAHSSNAHSSDAHSSDQRSNNEELFTREDLTGELSDYVQEAREKVPAFAAVLGRDQPPNLWPSRACNTCDCPEPCHDLPDHSVLTLPRLYYGHLSQIIEEGRWTLSEIEGHPHLKPKHQNYIQAARSGEPYVDTPEVREALSELKFPLYFLDFEAIDYALPPFEGTSPWEKVPFQYSLHVVEEGQESLRTEDVAHEEFLCADDGDPRQALAERLLEDIGREGSIVVYNATFEKGILEDLQDALPQEEFPRWEGRLESYIDRLWDQGKIFQNGHYVHPSQKGSWSLKKVLPAFDPGLEYDDLSVQEGMEAVVEYSRMISPETPDSEAQKIEEDLLKYCEWDTWAMVVIHKKLSALVGRDPTAPSRAPLSG